ncbi:MAG: NHL repeat-containing protein [Candidatus Binataceae bacterium]
MIARTSRLHGSSWFSIALATATIILSAVGVVRAAAGDTNADRVLGQVDMVHRGGISRSTTSSSSLTVDKDGHLYVADALNSRVLGWESAASFKNGQPADLVIGQRDFKTGLCNGGSIDSPPGAGTLCGSAGVGVDANSGDLWVADTSNCRVLEYNAPFNSCKSFPCVGLGANYVLGHNGSFTAGGCVEGGQVDATTLFLPTAAAVDSAGNVYVADTGADRVLEYNTPLTKTATPGSGDDIADMVFGQDGSFRTDTCRPVNRNSLCEPFGVAVDSIGNLYVADSHNNRVLEYNTPLKATSTPGSGDATADRVFAQVRNPRAGALDSSGNLYVADQGNNRVLEYNTPLTKTTTPGSGDTTPDRVFGQDGSFVRSACNGGSMIGDISGVGPDSLCSPTGVAADSAGNVYIADNQNNRVLEYNTPLCKTATRGSGDTVADRVLGQLDLRHPGGVNRSLLGPPGSASIAFGSSPAAWPISLDGVAVDSAGHLYAAEVLSNRVLGWKSAASLGNGQPADLVIGQSDFESGLCNRGATVSAGTLCTPRGIAVDLGSGDLYVADRANNRVLEYGAPFDACKSFPCVGTGANRVFGQRGNFTTRFCNGNASATGTNAATLCAPSGAAVDSAGNLYVADSSNSRVLEYNTPLQKTSTPGSGDTTADMVFGQNGSFIERGCNNTARGADGLCNPWGVAVDSADNVYIADTGNSRVLEYNTPLSSGDTTADLVFGQNGNGVGRGTLSYPKAVAVDPAGNLYIVDSNAGIPFGNHRVLEYNTPLSKTSTPGSGDTLADMVFGQDGNFNSNRCDGGTMAGDVAGIGPDSLCAPQGAALDSSGNLYVTDGRNARLLIYHQPVATGASASVPP